MGKSKHLNLKIFRWSDLLPSKDSEYPSSTDLRLLVASWLLPNSAYIGVPCYDQTHISWSVQLLCFLLWSSNAKNSHKYVVNLTRLSRFGRWWIWLIRCYCETVFIAHSPSFTLLKYLSCRLIDMVDIKPWACLVNFNVWLKSNDEIINEMRQPLGHGHIRCIFKHTLHEMCRPFRIICYHPSTQKYYGSVTVSIW